MIRKSIQRVLLAAMVAAGTLGAVAVPAIAEARTEVYVTVPPPPVRVERVPAPRRGYVWVPGYWDWRGHRHVWVRGVWQRERPGHVYRPHRWEERDGRWYYERGRWDRDGDGVPDSRDRHPDNPNRR